MFCKNCGNQLNKDSKFCEKCGNENTKENFLEKSSVSESIKVNEPVIKFHIGRLGQSGFMFSMMVSFIIIILIAILNVPTAISVTFIFINFAWMVLIYIGRLHDVGYSGWYTPLVMMTSLLGILILGSYSSKKEANKYGEIPPKSISYLLYFWRTK